MEVTPMVLFGYGIPLEYCKITGTVTRSEQSINLQCKQVVLIALSILFIMRHLGSVKSSRANVLAFAGLAAMLMTTACGNEPTGPNQAPEAFGSVDELIIDAGQSESLSVGSVFSDPDGDALTYTAESSNTAITTVSVSGNTVSLAGVNKGSTNVTVTATDPGGLSASVSISVTVVRFLGACSVGMELWPREACSVGSDRFSVWRRGYARFGCCIARTLGTRIQVGQFIASRIPGWDAWRIDSVPL
ncbi:MAG: hypothetical protein F4246_07100 [Rhodothermaceae bacterium]|nr:hypothetical protein [Rhodothermaceae bacterium]MXX59743.1 hypothetical protein [Rhodothermaceae bacterium]MYD56763.1 hypothetical protein [Rhodothermaceae bacterium]MYJ57067.1 hypothetical protein [Rhodothermaceae bacterium]